MAIRRQEDASDFAELVAARSAALFRTAFVVVGDHQLAQDLLQESLVKAYVAWPRLRDATMRSHTYVAPS
jgi:DNA-directed RNA polymerase specialized sigma24 family protein